MTVSLLCIFSNIMFPKLFFQIVVTFLLNTFWSLSPTFMIMLKIFYSFLKLPFFSPIFHHHFWLKFLFIPCLSCSYYLTIYIIICSESQFKYCSLKMKCTHHWIMYPITRSRAGDTIFKDCKNSWRQSFPRKWSTLGRAWGFCSLMGRAWGFCSLLLLPWVLP